MATYLFKLLFAAFFLFRDQAISNMLGLPIALFGPHSIFPLPQLRLAGGLENASGQCFSALCGGQVEVGVERARKDLCVNQTM